MSVTLQSLARDEAGATAIEYGLILALLCVAIITALNSFGASSDALWLYISDTIRAAVIS